MNHLSQTSPALKKAVETANYHMYKKLKEEKKEKDPEKISSSFVENVKKMEEKYKAEKISNEHVQMNTEAELQIPNPKKLLKKNPSKVKETNFKANKKKKRKLKKKSRQQNRKKV